MGTLIAIAILWWYISRSTPAATRRRERRVLGAAVFGSLLWLLDGVVNADKHLKR